MKATLETVRGVTINCDIDTAVIRTLKCKPIISDRRKLESYVNKRWCSKITMLMNAA